MAAQSKVNYATKSTYGSAAYDIFWQPYYEYDEEEVLVPEEKPQEKAVARTRTRKKTEGRYKFMLLSIAGIVFVAAVVVFVLLAYVQFTEVSHETAQLQEQLESLKEDEARLLIAYESAFNLNEVEDYAIGVLGMVKPSANQEVFISTTVPDKAVILDTEVEPAVTSRSFGEFLLSLLEYFK